MPVDADEQAWVAAGLLDPAAPDAEERRELLRFLTERGATVEEMTSFRDRDQLPSLAGELWRRDAPRITPEELARQAGIDVEGVLRVSAAAGLPNADPDEPTFRPEDVEAFRLFGGSIALFGEPALLEFTRSMGTALASIADSATAAFGINISDRFDERGISLVDRAKAVEAGAILLEQNLPDVLDTLFFHHVQAAVRRAVDSVGEAAHTAHLAIAFVDIVESTALVQELAPDVLADAIGAFEQRATEVVGSRKGRVVKTLGDEAMFVVADVAAACDAALELRDRIAEDDRLPGVRGAIAVGDLVRGYGDFYGPEVTIAARAVKIAEPGVILATDPVRAAAGGAFSFSSIGSHVPRGFAEPIELFVVERA
jgi:adenylate cyclase